MTEIQVYIMLIDGRRFAATYEEDEAVCDLCAVSEECVGRVMALVREWTPIYGNWIGTHGFGCPDGLNNWAVFNPDQVAAVSAVVPEEGER